MRNVGIAIVGGGIAGLYVGWRLAQRGIPSTVFEINERIGGRLWSAPLGARDGQVGELGAMRVPFDHHQVLDVANELDLTLVDFPSTSDSAWVHLRGVRLRRGEVERAGQFPYDLPTRFRNHHPDLLAAAVFRAAGVAGEPSTGGYESGPWLKGLNYAGRPLWQLRARELMTGVLGPHAAALLEDWGGYETPFMSASAWLGSHVALNHRDYLAVAGGFDQLTATMASQMRAGGGEVETSSEVLAILKNSPGRYRLQIRTRSGEMFEVAADHVVLALPAPAIKSLVRRSDLLSNERLVWALDHVVDRRAVKIYLAYDEDWWAGHGLRQGRTVTDTPLKQIYYGPRQADGSGVLLAAYALGGDSADYWAGLVPDSGSNAAHRIAPGLAQTVTAQLSRVHGQEIPTARSGLAHCWGPTSGAGIYLWREGVQPWLVAEQVVSPIPGEALYVCGDSMSMNQGWIVGALQTADSVLEIGFDQPSRGSESPAE